MYKPLILTYTCVQNYDGTDLGDIGSSSDVFRNFDILQCTIAVIMELHVENNGKLSCGERLD